MGSGSTIAAAANLGIRSVGVEVSSRYFRMARFGIPKLRDFETNGTDPQNDDEEGFV
jgi:DNA modification methylase